MTVIKVIECDGCRDEIKVDDCHTIDATLRFSSWQEDPEDAWQHYCPQCWNKVKEKYKE